MQAQGDLRGIGHEITVIEGQVYLTDQAIADLGVVVIRQHQLGGQGKERQLDFRQIAGIPQFDSRIVQPGLLIEQLQYQRKYGAVQDVHLQTLQRRVFQQYLLQVAQAGAVQMDHRAVGRQARRLGSCFRRAIVAAGELNAGNTQGRTQAFDQIRLQPGTVFRQQPFKQSWPASLYCLGIALEAFAHAVSPIFMQKNSAQGTPWALFLDAAGSTHGR
ncbi:hypothetical protein EMIT048CA2_100175 [Pseudomonas chlororaphis]